MLKLGYKNIFISMHILTNFHMFQHGSVVESTGLLNKMSWVRSLVQEIFPKYFFNVLKNSKIFFMF